MVFTDPKGGGETTIKVFEMKGKGPQRHQERKEGGSVSTILLVHVSKFDAESTACHEDASEKWGNLEQFSKWEEIQRQKQEFEPGTTS